jgi:hypothetical protein
MPNAYPTLPTDITSGPEGEADAFVVDRMGDGTHRVRVLHDDKLRLTILHPLLTAAEVQTLETFYAANRTFSIYYTHRGTQYECAFIGKPEVRYASPTYFNVTVRLAVVA